MLGYRRFFCLGRLRILPVLLYFLSVFSVFFVLVLLCFFLVFFSSL